MFKKQNIDDGDGDNGGSSSSDSSVVYASDIHGTDDSPRSGVGFHTDQRLGHGTWVAGIAAGAISAQSGLEAANCSAEEEACTGECLTAAAVESKRQNGRFDLDTFCPKYNCDGNDDMAFSSCLDNNTVTNLYENGGVAPGAKISVFDGVYSKGDNLQPLAGNRVWIAANETGAKIHSSSWDFGTLCGHTYLENTYDRFMYEVIHNTMPLCWTPIQQG